MAVRFKIKTLCFAGLLLGACAESGAADEPANQQDQDPTTTGQDAGSSSHAGQAATSGTRHDAAAADVVPYDEDAPSADQRDAGSSSYGSTHADAGSQEPVSHDAGSQEPVSHDAGSHEPVSHDAGSHEPASSDAGSHEPTSHDAGTPAHSDGGHGATHVDAGTPVPVPTPTPVPVPTNPCDSVSYANFGQGFMNSYCVDCHSGGNLAFNTLAGVKSMKTQIKNTTVSSRSMPRGSLQPSDAERVKLGQWLDCGPN